MGAEGDAGSKRNAGHMTGRGLRGRWGQQQRAGSARRSGEGTRRRQAARIAGRRDWPIRGAIDGRRGSSGCGRAAGRRCAGPGRYRRSWPFPEGHRDGPADGLRCHRRCGARHGAGWYPPRAGRGGAFKGGAQRRQASTASAARAGGSGSADTLADETTSRPARPAAAATARRSTLPLGGGHPQPPGDLHRALQAGQYRR